MRKRNFPGKWNDLSHWYSDKMHAVWSSKHCTLRSRKHQLYRDIKSRYQAAVENVITFTQFWHLLKWTTNSTWIRANWINCLLYKVLLNLHLLCWAKTVLSCILVCYIEAVYILIMIKIIVQFFEGKIPERVLLTGAIAMCKQLSKASVPWCKAKMYRRPVSPLNFYVLGIYINI